jgi:uncharacterized integral membrane protein
VPIRAMAPVTSDQLRAVWTFVGAIGTSAGIVCMAVVYWLHREAQRDDWALSQVTNPRLNFLRMHTQGEVADTSLFAWAVLALVLAVSAAFGAGVASILGSGQAALVLLLALVLALVAGVVLLVVLGVKRLQRRRSIFRTIRVNREANTEEATIGN